MKNTNKELKSLVSNFCKAGKRTSSEKLVCKVLIALNKEIKVVTEEEEFEAQEREREAKIQESTEEKAARRDKEAYLRMYKKISRKREFKLQGVLLRLRKIMDRGKPWISFRLRKRGATVHRLPIAMKEEKKLGVVVRWVVAGSTKPVIGTIASRLLREMRLTEKGEGESLKKRKKAQLIAEDTIPFLNI